MDRQIVCETSVVHLAFTPEQEALAQELREYFAGIGIGIGIDRGYPLHRNFLWAKVLELTLGGSSSRLQALGARIASESS